MFEIVGSTSFKTSCTTALTSTNLAVVIKEWIPLATALFTASFSRTAVTSEVTAGSSISPVTSEVSSGHSCDVRGDW